MSRPVVLRPDNRHLVVLADRQWPRTLLALLLLAGTLLGVLLLVGWPRLEALQTRYRVLELRQEVEALRRRVSALEVELERRRDPARLATRARELGLGPPPVAAVRPAEEGRP